MVFCNPLNVIRLLGTLIRHNPYFNRWFSAIKIVVYKQEIVSKVTILILIDGFLQLQKLSKVLITNGVTILILIDGFLQ